MNLLNELRKELKCEACRAFCLFFAMSQINLIIIICSRASGSEITIVVNRLECMALLHSQTGRHMISDFKPCNLPQISSKSIENKKVTDVCIENEIYER